MREYLFLIATYIILITLASMYSFKYYLVMVLASGAVLIYYWENYKLKFKFSWESILTGLIVAATWWLFDGKYPLLAQTATPALLSTSENLIRILGFIIITPFVEELFTRGFLIKYLINEKWKTVKPGKFTWFSFIATTLFFGFSHAEWLQGLVAGLLLNLLYYRTKRVEDCIIAHGLANATLLL